MPREVNVLALIKDEERYVYVYDDASRDMLLGYFRQQAADANLGRPWSNPLESAITWYSSAAATATSKCCAIGAASPCPTAG